MVRRIKTFITVSFLLMVLAVGIDTGLNTAKLNNLILATKVLSSTVRKTSKELNLKILESTGVITNGMGHGSCVAIGPDLVLTAGHCIGIDGAWIEIQGTQYRILEEWKSENYDIGFVRVEGKLPYIELGEMPELLDRVYLVGSPYDRMYINTINVGIISSLERVGLIQTDAEGAPGSSGCPLLDINSQIVGICVAGPNPGGGVTLCEPVSHIKEALEEYDDR